MGRGPAVLRQRGTKEVSKVMRYEIIQRFSLLNVKFELGTKAVLLRVPPYSVVNGRCRGFAESNCRIVDADRRGGRGRTDDVSYGWLMIGIT